MQKGDDEKILVDQNGYNQFIENLERLKEQGNQNSLLGSQAYVDAIGDGWHDNFAFEETMRESRTIAKMIENMYEVKKKLTIVKDLKKDNKRVNIGDVIKVEIAYNQNDVEMDLLKLTGNYIPNDNGVNQEITLNSPLGKALYKAKIGSKIKYCVDGREIIVNIISKEQ